VAKFIYKATDLRGSHIQGELEAASKQDAVEALEKRKLTILSVKRDIDLNPFKNRVSGAVISRFTRQLSAMVSSGLPLAEALGVLSKQRDSRKMQTMVQSVLDDIKAGKPFHEALGKHQAILGPLYVSLVKAGESAGALGEILERLADHLEKSDAIKRKVRGALLYPAVILLVAISAVAILLVFVVPSFAKMFADLNKELPMLTLVIINACTFIKTKIILILAAVAALFLAYGRVKKTARFRSAMDGFVLKIPYFGSLLKKAAIGRFTRTLATLLKGGVPLVKALEICSAAAGNMRIEKVILDSVRNVSSGNPLHESLSKDPLFPEMTIQMIAVGEKIGELSKMMERVALFYDGEVSAAVDSVLSIIEPVMIVFLAVIIGVILIAMYLPLFDMMTGMS